MAFPGFDTAASTTQIFRALVRSPRERLTLDQLRSDLSHESAAKVARLSGLVEEWRHGRFQTGDVPAAREILRDLQQVYLRHPRPACARYGTFARLVRLLRILRAARRQMAAFSPPAAPGAEPVARFGLWVAVLASESRALVDSVSRRYGIRFAHLVENAAAEILSESGQGSAAAIVEVKTSDAGPGVWVPRNEAAAWTDVLRNLIRNAVQATAERRPTRSAPATVQIKPLASRSGTSIEILDEGIGMSADEAAQMWCEGRSRHGTSRGRGLTESKRAFIERRAALEVRSAPGVGTCVRIDVPHRDIAIRTEPLWLSPPLVVPGVVLLAAALFALPLFIRPPVAAVEVEGQRVVRALDAKGSLLWQRDLEATVMPNWGTECGPAGPLPAPLLPPIVLNRPWPRSSGVIVSTMPPAGSGSVWCLGDRGRTEWVYPLRWWGAGGGDAVALACVSEFLVPWTGEKSQALALNVRDRNFSSTAIQFITLAGDSLAAYHHPGHLQFHSVGDPDGDGRPELLLNGVNNDARGDSSYIPTDPGEGFYADCLVLLEPPAVAGQAYPGHRWPAMPRASEDAYLIFPPLQDCKRPFVEFLTVSKPGGSDTTRIEVILRDGRIYTLDGSLRPLTCAVGDHTDAARALSPVAQAPFIYFHNGIRETIDLPIRR